MRAIDLAIYADALAGEAASLSARAERARSRLRQAAIEREAVAELPAETITRLRGLGVLHDGDDAVAREDLAELARSLAALRELQAWVERRLVEAERADQAGERATSSPPSVS